MSWNLERYNEVLQDTITDLHNGNAMVHHCKSRLEDEVNNQDWEAAKAIKDAIEQYLNEKIK